MAIEDTWLTNLKKLVESEGGGRKGIRSVADNAGLSEEYIYQLVAEKPKKDGTPRSVGKEAANKIAGAFSDGRPPNWFDLADTPSDSIPADLITKNMEDWRKKASPRSLAVIDTLLVAIQQERFTEEDWLLYQQLNQRLLQRRP